MDAAVTKRDVGGADTATTFALRLVRTDGSAKSVREVTSDPATLAGAFVLLRAFGRRLSSTRAEVLQRALGVDGDRESLADVARRWNVSRVRVHAVFRSAVEDLIQLAATTDAEIATSTSTALERSSSIGPLERWGRLTPEERRRRAIQAAHARDADTLWDLTDYVLTTRGRRRASSSPHTRSAYRRGVRHLVQSWSHENLLRPSIDAGALYLVHLETEPIERRARGPITSSPRAASTVAVHLSAAKALYRALRHVGATDADPFRDLRSAVDPQAPEDKREAYTATDVAKLLRVAEPHDAALVHLCATAGLRNAEATSLTWAQVDEVRGLLRRVVGKGGRVRDVPVADAVIRAVSGLRTVNVSPDDGVLGFGTAAARNRLRRLCHRAGVRYVGRQVHGLRHTAGTETARRHGIDAAADLLRHANLQTTRRYAKRSQEERKAVSDDLAAGYARNLNDDR